MSDSVVVLQRTEQIVRLEIQRRELRDVLKISDDIMREIDDQLHVVAQLKKEWLTRVKGFEQERLALAAREAQQRSAIDEMQQQALEHIVGPHKEVRARVKLVKAKIGR